MTTFEDSFSEEIWNITYKHHSDNTVDDTLRRVAKSISSVEKTPELQKEWEEKFYDMLSDFKCTTGGRIMSNAGTEWSTSMLNCFVSGLPEQDVDSLEGILQILKESALTLKSEGGWGFTFNFIRPRGTFIQGIGVETPGSIRFMELFDKSSDIITSGSGLVPKNKKAKGKIRKGAMMSILSVWHPDIIEFITAKQTPGRLTKFNMSVDCTDDFMALINKIENMKKNGASEEEINEVDKWDLIFPDTTHSAYKADWKGDISDWVQKGYPIEVHNTVKASWLWNLIMESTYNRAEPGVIFLDRANKLNTLYYADKIFATNPCAEQVLGEYGSCLLGSINLALMVDEQTRRFDYEKIKKYITYLVRFLDNTNDATLTPLDKYKEVLQSKRRIGVGILGWASSLYMMKVRFSSEEANRIREEVMKTIAYTAYRASVELAKEKGAFPLCDNEKHAVGAFIEQIELPEDIVQDIRKYGIRNSAILTCAPTGNSSLTANIVSGGIEPVFMQEYIRTVSIPDVPEHLRDVTPKFWEGQFEETSFFKEHKEGDDLLLRGVDENNVVWKIDKGRGLTKEVPCEDYGVRWLKARNEWDPTADWAVTAMDLSVSDHLNDLQGFSKYIDTSISKTISIPNDYSFDDFKKVYLDAYNTGFIKGITTYRVGTMTSVLSAKEENDAVKNNAEEEIIFEDIKLPDSSPAMVKKIVSEGKKWYFIVVFDENMNRPIALFVKTNNTEKTVTTNDAVEKLLQLAYSKNIPEKHIKDVEGKIINIPNSDKIARVISLLLRHGVWIKNIISTIDTVDNVVVGSFLFQIKKFLSNYLKEGEINIDEICPNCGGKLIFSEGCMKCMSCGQSKCS